MKKFRYLFAISILTVTFVLPLFSRAVWDGNPYDPNETLDPECTPVQVSCTVLIGSITLSTGTSGTDVNVSGSPAELGGTLTLNIPSAGSSTRGLVSTGVQTFGGAKTFSGNTTLQGLMTFGNEITDDITVNSASMTFNSDTGFYLPSSQNAFAFRVGLSDLFGLDTLNRRVIVSGTHTSSNDAR